IDSSPSDWRELGGAHDVFRLCFGIDMRDYNTVHTTIQRPSDNPRFIGIYPQHRSHAPEVTGSRHVVNLVPRHGSVFAFEPETVKAQRSKEIYRMSAVVMSPNDCCDFARLKFRFDSVVPHVHVCSFGSSDIWSHTPTSNCPNLVVVLRGFVPTMQYLLSSLSLVGWQIVQAHSRGRATGKGIANRKLIPTQGSAAAFGSLPALPGPVGKDFPIPSKTH